MARVGGEVPLHRLAVERPGLFEARTATLGALALALAFPLATLGALATLPTLAAFGAASKGVGIAVSISTISAAQVERLGVTDGNDGGSSESC